MTPCYLPFSCRNVADLSRRTPRPRSLGGRRLKGGSEVNSLREKAIKAEGSREGSRRQAGIKEPAIEAEEGNRILLPTRMPQHKQLISKLHQPSPLIMSTASSQLESVKNPDLEENEEESTTILPIDIFDGQYHEVNPGQYNETNPGHPCQIRVSMDGDSLLMKGCSRPVPRSEPGPVPREEPRPIRGT